MKKRIIILSIVVILLGGLLALYIVLLNNPAPATYHSAADDIVRIYDKDKDMAESMQLKALNGVEINIKKVYDPAAEEGSTWVSSDYPTMKLLPIKVDSIVNAACKLFAEGILMEKADDLSQYGLDGETESITVNFSDGTFIHFLIGDMTTDKMYNYAKDSEKDTIYLLSSSAWYGMKQFYDITIDKTFTPVAHIDFTEMYIKDKSSKYTIAAHREAENVTSDGSVYTLTLSEPYPGRTFELAAFTEDIYLTLDNFKLGSLVNMNPTGDEYAGYGLDAPSLELFFKADDYSQFKLTVGKSAGDGNVYVQYGEYPFVFLTKEETLKPFYNINLFKYIKKSMLDLVIEEIDNITLTYKGTTHILEPNFSDKKPDSLIVGPIINGKSAPPDDFIDIFEAVANLSIDIPIEEFVPKSEPEVTIVYNFLDTQREPVIDKYYDYNDAYYAVEQEGAEIQFAMRKQFIEVTIEKINNVVQ